VDTDAEAAFADLTRFELDPELARRLPEEFCRENQLVLLGKAPESPGAVVPLGMLDLSLEKAVRHVEGKLQWRVRPVQLNAFEIDRAIGVAFGKEESLPQERVFLVGDGRERIRLHHDAEIEFDRDQSTPKMVIDALSEAVARRASDVHIEVYSSDVDLRFRIDGVMHEVPTPFSLDNVRSVISYVKVLAELDIAERRRPKDGRIGTTYTDADGETRQVDFRVATLPGPHGEDMVLRVLDERQMRLGLGEIGMPDGLIERYRELIRAPGGMVLVTGPTASGKTTTLYASIREINHDGNKILSVEEPIEYELANVNQKQVSSRLSFADYARAFMRQDPDVVLIGEIRDEETASIALRAAQMGHLVLTTLHTRDAASAIARMITLGGERSIVVSGLNAVMSQRLVRTVCPDCAEEYTPAPEVLARLSEPPAKTAFVRGSGCARCGGTGYYGRTAVFELLTFDDRLRLAVARGADIEMGEQLEWLQFPRMYDDAIDKAARGVTTVEEVLRAVPLPDESVFRRRAK